MTKVNQRQMGFYASSSKKLTEQGNLPTICRSKQRAGMQAKTIRLRISSQKGDKKETSLLSIFL